MNACPSVTSTFESVDRCDDDAVHSRTPKSRGTVRDGWSERRDDRSIAATSVRQGSDGAQYGAQVSGKIIEKSRLSALTCENRSGAEGTRTPDPLHAMQVRYQLRHSPGNAASLAVAGGHPKIIAIWPG